MKDVLAYARLLENPRDEAAFSRDRQRRRAAASGRRPSRACAAVATERGHQRPRGRGPGGGRGLRQGPQGPRPAPRLPRAPAGPGRRPRSARSSRPSSTESRLSRRPARAGGRPRAVAASRTSTSWWRRPARPTAPEPGITLSALPRDGRRSRRSRTGSRRRPAGVSAHDRPRREGPRVRRGGGPGRRGGLVPPRAQRGPRPRTSRRSGGSSTSRMTRARKRLALTHVGQREGWQGVERRLPSRFLADVPDDLVEVRDGTGLYARDRARGERRGMDGPRRARGFDAFDEPPADDAFDPDAGPARPDRTRDAPRDVREAPARRRRRRRVRARRDRRRRRPSGARRPRRAPVLRRRAAGLHVGRRAPRGA